EAFSVDRAGASDETFYYDISLGGFANRFASVSLIGRSVNIRDVLGGVVLLDVRAGVLSLTVGHNGYVRGAEAITVGTLWAGGWGGAQGTLLLTHQANRIGTVSLGASGQTAALHNAQDLSLAEARLKTLSASISGTFKVGGQHNAIENLWATAGALDLSNAADLTLQNVLLSEGLTLSLRGTLTGAVATVSVGTSARLTAGGVKLDSGTVSIPVISATVDDALTLRVADSLTLSLTGDVADASVSVEKYLEVRDYSGTHHVWAPTVSLSAAQDITLGTVTVTQTLYIRAGRNVLHDPRPKPLDPNDDNYEFDMRVRFVDISAGQRAHRLQMAHSLAPIQTVRIKGVQGVQLAANELTLLEVTARHAEFAAAGAIQALRPISASSLKLVAVSLTLVGDPYSPGDFLLRESLYHINATQAGNAIGTLLAWGSDIRVNDGGDLTLSEIYASESLVLSVQHDVHFVDARHPGVGPDVALVSASVMLISAGGHINLSAIRAGLKLRADTMTLSLGGTLRGEDDNSDIDVLSASLLSLRGHASVALPVSVSLLSLDAAEHGVSLIHGDNRIENLWGTAEAVNLSNTIDLTLGNVLATELLIDASGGLVDAAGASLSVASAALSASAIALDNPRHDIDTVMTMTASLGAVLFDVDDLLVRTATAGGTLSLSVAESLSARTLDAGGVVVHAGESLSARLIDSGGELTASVGGGAFIGTLQADQVISVTAHSLRIRELSAASSATLRGRDAIGLTRGTLGGDGVLSAPGEEADISVFGTLQYARGLTIHAGNRAFAARLLGTNQAGAPTTLVAQRGDLSVNYVRPGQAPSAGSNDNLLHLSAGGNLSVAGDFRWVHLRAKGGTLSDLDDTPDGVLLQSLLVAEGLRISSGGDIGQGAIGAGAFGSLSVGGTLLLQGDRLYLTHAGNRFGGAVSVSLAGAQVSGAPSRELRLSAAGDLNLKHLGDAGRLRIGVAGDLIWRADDLGTTLSSPLASPDGTVSAGVHVSAVGRWAFKNGMTILAGSGDLVIGDSSSINFEGDLNLSAGNDADIEALLRNRGSGAVRVSASGGTNLGHQFNDIARLGLSAGAATVSNAKALSLLPLSVSDDLRLRIASDLVQRNAMTVGGYADISAFGSVLLSDAVIATLGLSAEALTLIGSGDQTVRHLSVGTELTISLADTLRKLDNSSRIRARHALLSIGGELSLAVEIPDITVTALGASLSNFQKFRLSANIGSSGLWVSGDAGVELDGVAVSAGGAGVWGSEISVLGGVDADGNPYGGVTVSAGGLSMSAPGVVDVPGPLTVSGPLAISAGNLARISNLHVSLAGAVTLSANNAQFSLGRSDVSLADVNVVNRLEMHGQGHVRQLAGSSISVDILDLSMHGEALLTESGNAFRLVYVAMRPWAIWTASTAWVFGGSNGHDLYISAAGDIYQAGAVVKALGGVAVFAAGTQQRRGDIYLTNSDNEFETLALYAGDVFLTNSSALALGPSDIEGDLSVNVRSGDLAQVDYPSLTRYVTVQDGATVTLPILRSLNFVSAGVSALSVGGLFSATVQRGAIRLGLDANDFGGLVHGHAAGAIHLRDANHLSLYVLSTSGSDPDERREISVSAGGSIALYGSKYVSSEDDGEGVVMHGAVRLFHGGDTTIRSGGGNILINAGTALGIDAGNLNSPVTLKVQAPAGTVHLGDIGTERQLAGVEIDTRDGDVRINNISVRDAITVNAGILHLAYERNAALVAAGRLGVISLNPVTGTLHRHLSIHTSRALVPQLENPPTAFGIHIGGRGIVAAGSLAPPSLDINAGDGILRVIGALGTAELPFSDVVVHQAGQVLINDIVVTNALTLHGADIFAHGSLYRAGSTLHIRSTLSGGGDGLGVLQLAGDFPVLMQVSAGDARISARIEDAAQIESNGIYINEGGDSELVISVSGRLDIDGPAGLEDPLYAFTASASEMHVRDIVVSRELSLSSGAGGAHLSGYLYSVIAEGGLIDFAGSVWIDAPRDAERSSGHTAPFGANRAELERVGNGDAVYIGVPHGTISVRGGLNAGEDAAGEVVFNVGTRGVAHFAAGVGTSAPLQRLVFAAGTLSASSSDDFDTDELIVEGTALFNGNLTLGSLFDLSGSVVVGRDLLQSQGGAVAILADGAELSAGRSMHLATVSSGGGAFLSAAAEIRVGKLDMKDLSIAGGRATMYGTVDGYSLNYADEQVTVLGQFNGPYRLNDYYIYANRVRGVDNEHLAALNAFQHLHAHQDPYWQGSFRQHKLEHKAEVLKRRFELLLDNRLVQRLDLDMDEFGDRPVRVVAAAMLDAAEIADPSRRGQYLQIEEREREDEFSLAEDRLRGFYVDELMTLRALAERLAEPHDDIDIYQVLFAIAGFNVELFELAAPIPIPSGRFVVLPSLEQVRQIEDPLQAYIRWRHEHGERPNGNIVSSYMKREDEVSVRDFVEKALTELEYRRVRSIRQLIKLAEDLVRHTVLSREQALVALLMRNPSAFEDDSELVTFKRRSNLVLPLLTDIAKIDYEYALGATAGLLDPEPDAEAAFARDDGRLLRRYRARSGETLDSLSLALAQDLRMPVAVMRRELIRLNGSAIPLRGPMPQGVYYLVPASADFKVGEEELAGVIDGASAQSALPDLRQLTDQTGEDRFHDIVRLYEERPGAAARGADIFDSDADVVSGDFDGIPDAPANDASQGEVLARAQTVDSDEQVAEPVEAPVIDEDSLGYSGQGVGSVAARVEGVASDDEVAQPDEDSETLPGTGAAAARVQVFLDDSGLMADDVDDDLRGSDDATDADDVDDDQAGAGEIRRLDNRDSIGGGLLGSDDSQGAQDLPGAQDVDDDDDGAGEIRRLDGMDNIDDADPTDPDQYVPLLQELDSMTDPDVDRDVDIDVGSPVDGDANNPVDRDVDIDVGSSVDGGVDTDAAGAQQTGPAVQAEPSRAFAERGGRDSEVYIAVVGEPLENLAARLAGALSVRPDEARTWLTELNPILEVTEEIEDGSPYIVPAGFDAAQGAGEMLAVAEAARLEEESLERARRTIRRRGGLGLYRIDRPMTKEQLVESVARVQRLLTDNARDLLEELNPSLRDAEDLTPGHYYAVPDDAANVADQ
ncbi:MAG: hypothetical protein ISN29_08275, partial [Gammaproteobacteria bacterium AqS3]|nr:hypothetical protein [Gammaproteobacteria bacterium AqS3]